MKTAYVAFKNPATGKIENEGPSIRLYRPSTWNLDAALWRLFPELKMDFRLEAFNLFTHTRLNNSKTTINNNNFAKNTSLQDPRIKQAALKVNF